MNITLHKLAGHLGTLPGTKRKSVIRLPAAKSTLVRKRLAAAARKKVPEVNAHIFDYGNAT